MTDPAAATAPRAGLRRRLAALVYEALLLAAIVLLAGFLLTPLMSPVGGGDRALVVPSAWRRAAGFAALVAVAGAYFVHGWSGGRRTLPMKTWRLALVDAGGHPLARRQALARFAAAWIGPACAIALYAITHSRWALAALALNYAWAWIDANRDFLHDRIAGTVLVSEAPGQVPRGPGSGPGAPPASEPGARGI